MSKRLCLRGLACLLVFLVLAGCKSSPPVADTTPESAVTEAQEEPPAESAPTPTPTATPTPAASPEPTPTPIPEETPMNKINVSFNGHTYTATLADNSSVTAFVELLKDNGGSIVVAAHDYGNFEKVGDLPASIVQNNTQINTTPGDLILYLGNSICLYYSANSWNFTRLGRLDGDLSNLKNDLGSGDVDITYSLAQ